MKKKKQYNCFKFVGMLFCMLVCILLFPKETFAEESNYITVTYAKNINSGFLYSDDMMLTNANDLSTDIAKMAMGLANVAYSEKAVKQCLSDMEYSLLGGDTYNYTKNTYTYTNNDYVDYSIGYKQYKGYNIYLVVIKGTGTNYDWFSNFNLGKGDYHQGFKLAADGVLNTINSKVKTSNNIFLVTGHSRGAAVANIVAAELTADGSLASSDHIFGYTYACPAVKIGADTSYKNIRNYNNPGDAVPELPLEAWGYERYGETINLSTQSDIYQNFKQRFKSVEGENYAGVVNTDSFVSTLLALADTRDAYYNPDNHLWFDFFAYLLGPASKESIDWSVVAQIIKDNDITGATASCLIHILQDAVSTGITALSKVENSEGSWKSEFMSRIDSALLETKEYTDEEFKTWLTSKPYVVAEIRKEFHIEVETRQSLVAAQRTLESELDNYSPMLANGETLLYLFFSTDFKPVSAISHGHQPSSYVLWINSMYYGYEGWKGNTEITNVDLNGIDTIGENCFCNCTKLSRINGMNSITAFGNSAFYNLSKLKVVGKFAAQVKYIGNYAFSGCSNMTGEIKQISEYIGTSAFSGCSGITGKVILSGKLGKVSEKAFSNTGIKEVEVQDGIETIGGDAFAVCKNLEKVMIADSVRTIGRSAFEHCSSLKEITLPISAKYDTYVNGGSTTSATFVDVQAEKIVFTKGTGEVFVPETDKDWYHSNISLPWYSKDSLKEVEFEEGIEKIYAEALSGCWKVETIKIPETVKKIGDRAFANCTSWAGELYLPKGLKSIGEGAFFNCSRLTNILVPALQTELNTNCFDSNITTVLWGLNNSTTETYAAANNITFKAINYPYLTYDNIKVLTPGQNYRFIATVFTDINESTDKVTWAIAGSVSDDTIIDASGLLSVAANESAKELTVSANYGGEISSMKFAVEMDEHEHTYEYQITKDATCTEVGIATYTCSLCGDSYMEEIPALGHDYGEWKTVKEATYTEEGLEEQICSRDPSHKQTRSIPKRKIPFSLVELQLSDTVYVYDGKEKKPTVTITYNGKVLAEGVDYSIRYSDNVNPGTATITVEAKENSSYIGSIQKKFVIRPAMEDNTVVVQPNAFEGCSNIINLNIRATVTEIGTQAFADCKNLNSIYFYGNCPKIGENIFRNVKATAYYPCNDMSWTIDRLQDYGGKITWCPWDPATGKPAKRSLSICELSVNVGTQLYDGKVKTPQVAVKDGNKVLQANVDYVVSYQNNVNPGTGTITVSGTGSYGGTLTARFTIQKGNNVISVSEITKNYSAKTQKAKTNARAYGGAGLTYASNSKSVKIDKYGRIKITKKFVGRAVITVRASETPNYRAASRQFTVTVRPSATSISKASNSAKKKMTVSWKKNKTCSGYALQYSTDKKFKKGVKTVYISKNSRTKTTVSRLAKGKTYYVRLASYKKAGNTKILSKWSKVKKVKIRK